MKNMACEGSTVAAAGGLLMLVPGITLRKNTCGTPRLLIKKTCIEGFDQELHTQPSRSNPVTPM